MKDMYIREGIVFVKAFENLAAVVYSKVGKFEDGEYKPNPIIDQRQFSLEIAEAKRVHRVSYHGSDT